MGELKPLLTEEALVERALAHGDWAVAQGLLAIRAAMWTPSDAPSLPVRDAGGEAPWPYP